MFSNDIVLVFLRHRLAVSSVRFSPPFPCSKLVDGLCQTGPFTKSTLADYVYSKQLLRQKKANHEQEIQRTHHDSTSSESSVGSKSS